MVSSILATKSVVSYSLSYMKLNITRAGRKHVLAVAQRSYPLTSRATRDAAYVYNQESDEDAAEREGPQRCASAGTQHSRASSKVPLNGPVSNSDHSRSPSLPDSAEGFGSASCTVATEITREVSVRRNWDIYAKRNDLSM